MNIKKKCKECGKETLDNTFNKNKKYCSKYCCQKNWRINNQEHINNTKREYNKKKSYYKNYYRLNKDKICTNQKKYSSKEKSKEKKRICARKNYHLNKEKRKTKEFKLKRNVFLRGYTKKKRAYDKNYRIKELLRNRFFYALRAYTKGKIVSSTKYGINYKKIIEHLEPFPKNPSKYHIDHIKPLFSFNLTNPQEVKIAFAPENHQLLTIEEHKNKTKQEIPIWRKNVKELEDKSNTNKLDIQYGRVLKSI